MEMTYEPQFILQQLAKLRINYCLV